MEIPATSMKNLNRVLLVLTIITILSSICSAHIFKKTLFDPSNIEAEEDQEFSEGKTRVKRQNRPCPFPTINCNNVPNVNNFRTIDGTCNNFNQPYCGASDTAFARYLPRTPAGQGLRCPNCPPPRNVTFAMNNLCPQDEKDNITVMVMQWGQFVDHDLVITPEVEDPQCCQDFRTLTPTSSACVPIDVSKDPFYRSLSTTVNCLPFVRSRPATCPVTSDRQNINSNTAYLDGSMIYGSTQADANNLRTFSGGKLKVGSGSGATPCPGTTPDVCPRSLLPSRTRSTGQPEFFGGDSRVEEQPLLTCIHTLFVRFHNDVTNFFNCGNDEATYQVTRKIVIAIIQQITFSEFLPIVLGDSIMNDELFGVLSLSKSYSYDPSICAASPNSFATAAYRFGHSLVPNDFRLSSGSTVQLSRSFNNHGVTLNSGATPSHFLAGTVNQTSMPMDQMLVDAISNFLFAQGPSFEFGSDLGARNILRGRDHGIPSYVTWYNQCIKFTGKSPISKFDDLYNLMPSCVVNQFKTLYKNNVNDIDLFPAGVAEKKVPDGLVGPTFACIIAEHFSDLKYGDRFWFQRNGLFTFQQRNSISRTFLSSLICLYTNVERIQPSVMLPVSDSNPLLSCRTILSQGFLSDMTEPIWDGLC